MFGSINIKGVLLTTLAVLFVAAFATQAYAFDFGAAGSPFTYTGKIVAIDREEGTATVEAGPADQQMFSLNDHGSVMKCDELVSLSDLRIGDEVTVTYFDQGNGLLIANEIDYAASEMQRC